MQLPLSTSTATELSKLLDMMLDGKPYPMDREILSDLQSDLLDVIDLEAERQHLERTTNPEEPLTTTYRVDRADSLHVPCGTNSILYLGNRAADARTTFYAAPTGIDPWGKPDPTYGLLLSRWNGQTYIIEISRFPGLPNHDNSI